MAEKENVASGTPAKSSTQEKPTAPAAQKTKGESKPSTQGKNTNLPTAGDFHVTRDQPWVASTDSGYKVYADRTVTIKSGTYDAVGRPMTGLMLQGPDGKPIGYWDEQIQKWVNPTGNGIVDDLAGLKPDPAWSAPTAAEPPDLSKNPDIFKPGPPGKIDDVT